MSLWRSSLRPVRRSARAKAIAAALVKPPGVSSHALAAAVISVHSSSLKQGSTRWRRGTTRRRRWCAMVSAGLKVAEAVAHGVGAGSS
jgi:hypothetical protein